MLRIVGLSSNETAAFEEEVRKHMVLRHCAVSLRVEDDLRWTFDATTEAEDALTKRRLVVQHYSPNAPTWFLYHAIRHLCHGFSIRTGV